MFLLVCSAFFSATETAFLSANRTKLKLLSQEGNRKAESTLKTTEKFDQFLSTALLGNNIVNILASSIATVFFISYFGNIGVTIATSVTTILVLIFGEITPKIIAKENPEKFAMFSNLPMRFFMLAFTPINYFFTAWKKILVKVFHIRKDNTVTEAELLTFVEEVRQVGGINEGEEHLIRNAIEFDETTANDILTPRVDMTAVSVNDTVESIEKCFCETGYSRLPVYRDSIDNIIGIVLLKDFFIKTVREHNPLESIIMPAIYISETIKITSLLKKLQAKKSHLAVVIDEFGGTVGIVTMEDIVEELVGEIWDEHDEAMENIIQLANGNYRILGNTSLKDFFEVIGMDEKDLDANASTAGGWVIEYLGEIPREGQQFIINNFAVTILKKTRNRVMELEVIKTGNSE